MALATDHLMDKNRHITLRVTQAEALEIQRLSVTDKSTSAYIRRLINEDKARRTK